MTNSETQGRWRPSAHTYGSHTDSVRLDAVHLQPASVTKCVTGFPRRRATGRTIGYAKIQAAATKLMHGKIRYVTPK